MELPLNAKTLAGFILAADIPAGGAVQAAPVCVDTFSGDECGGQGGFANCYATPTGTQQGNSPGASPSIYKRNSDGSSDFGNFASITGNEFAVNYTASLALSGLGLLGMGMVRRHKDIQEG